MTLSSRFWAELSTLEFSDRLSSGEAAHTVAVLPVAATEQHGPHLPLSVDTVLVEGVVAAALPHLAPDLPVLFLPTQAVGFSPEHARFPGTLTLRSDTIVRLWTEIGECVAAAGVKKLVLFNAHGGQVSVMDLVARDLRARLDMLVYSVSWFNLPLVDPQGGNVNDLFSAEEHRFGIHAGDVETSMMLALDPSHVDMPKARHFHSTSQDRATQFDILGNGKSAKLGWQTQDYNAAGAVGNAAAATVDKGQVLVEAAGVSLARLLSQVHQLPMSTLVSSPDFSPR